MAGMARVRTLRTALAAAVALGALAPSARAYEFSARARTLAQVYQLRSYRLAGDDVWMPRRRIGQSLTLAIWDIGGLAEARARSRRAAGGALVSWHSHLRVDHDFGAFAAGRVALDGFADPVDALDAIPELGDDTLALTLAYGYLQVDGLLANRLRLRAGRLIDLAADDLRLVDGAEVTGQLAPWLDVSVSGGLRVRDASPLASSASELDGTSGAECQEFVEGAAPGQGRWQLLDRSAVIGNRRLASDLYLCPQRNQWMPTVAATAHAAVGRRVDAQLSYRRTQSRTVGLIGAVDRLSQPDLGLYPNAVGQAPAWGTNEEVVLAQVQGRARLGGVTLTPLAWARRNLVMARFDRAGASVGVRRGAQRLTPEVSVVVPSFDADSIFSVFAVDPATDLRLAWALTPGDAGWQARAQGWGRRYGDRDGAAWAYGVDGAVQRRAGVWSGTATALADGGVGGSRLGGSLGLERRRRAGTLAGQLGAWRIWPDDLAAGERSATTALTMQASSTWVLGPQAALHVVGEATSDRYAPLTVRTLAVLDLAFEPEM